jgi:hypothetical protein
VLADLAEKAQQAEAFGPEASARIALAEMLLGTDPPRAAQEALRALALAEKAGNQGAVEHILGILQKLG